MLVQRIDDERAEIRVEKLTVRDKRTTLPQSEGTYIRELLLDYWVPPDAASTTLK